MSASRAHVQASIVGERELTVGARLESFRVGASSSPIVRDLLNVKFPDGESIADLCWGRGNFYTDVRGWRVFGFDIAAKDGVVARADAARAPVRAAAVDVAVFDPPYLNDRRGNWCHLERYGQLDERGLPALLADVAPELRRIARLGCIVKVQDVVDGRRPLWHSFAVFEAFRAIGFEPSELVTFLPTGGRMAGWNWDRQWFLRRNHSYFFAYEWQPRRRSKERAIRRLQAPRRLEAPQSAMALDDEDPARALQEVTA